MTTALEQNLVTEFRASFSGPPIHVAILLTILIGDQYDSKKLVLVSPFKKIFITSILSQGDRKMQVVTDQS